jgi:hypothetical protein
MSKLQRKISDKIGRYDWVEGVTEYESEGLPTPEAGPYELDAGFEEIYGFDVLHKLVNEYQNKFKKQIIKKIGLADYQQIETCLDAYISSSTKKNSDIDILKASILNAFGDILHDSFNTSDEGVKQFYGSDYFEKTDDLIIDKKLLINPDSIFTYKKLATKYTIKCIGKYLKKTESVWELDDFEVYRGLGNYRYYKRKAIDNFTDIISKFSGIGMEAFEYFERQIFSSYTISERLSERFMVQKSNQRRAKVTTSFKVVSSNMFSSFIVCDKFNINQYEILCLPFTEKHYIFEEVIDKMSADFFINDNEEYPGYRLPRAKVE